MDKIKLNNIRITYEEYLLDVKSFPDFSPAKKRAKQKLKEYMKRIRDEYGQEVVTKICGGMVKARPSTQQ